MRGIITALLLLSLLPAPARQRLLVIGDSLARGLASSSEETRYASLVAREAGFDLGTLYARDLPQAEQAWPGWGWQADVIILEIGLNDVLGETSPEATWQARYGAFLDQLATTGARIVVATPFRGVYRGHPKWETLERYAGYIRAAAQARGIAVADLWGIECVPKCLSQAADPTPYPPLFTGDNFHPNDEGHRLIANALLAALHTRVLLPVAALISGSYLKRQIVRFADSIILGLHHQVLVFVAGVGNLCGNLPAGEAVVPTDLIYFTVFDLGFR